MKPELIMASGRTFKVPMFDPLVARHFGYASSYVETLLREISDCQIYAPLFRGKKDLTFLDIGANIGLVSIYAADSCARIVAIEPAPETFNVLRSMTLGLKQIECVCAALAPEDGPCEFFRNQDNTTASSTVNTFGEFMQVNGLKLSSILRIHQLEHVDVCKCDVEGAEGESLTFEELHDARMIKSWWIETHNCPKSSWQEKQNRIRDDLSKLGYQTTVRGMVLEAAL